MYVLKLTGIELQIAFQDYKNIYLESELTVMLVGLLWLFASAADPINGKNEPLLSLLQSVYVESTDPAAAAQVSQPRHSGHSRSGVSNPLK